MMVFLDIIFRLGLLGYIVLGAIFKYEQFGQKKDGCVSPLFMLSFICDLSMAFLVMFHGV